MLAFVCGGLPRLRPVAFGFGLVNSKMNEKREREKVGRARGVHLVAPRRVLTARVSALHTESVVCGEVVVVHVCACLHGHIFGCCAN